MSKLQPQCNYLLKTKQNKKYTHIYAPQGRRLSNLCTTHIPFATSELTALPVVYAVSPSCQTQLVLMQLHRLAHRMQEMPPQTPHISPAPSHSSSSSHFISYPSISNSIIMVSTSFPYVLDLINLYKVNPMPLKSLQVFFMTLRIKFKFL